MRKSSSCRNSLANLLHNVVSSLPRLIGIRLRNFVVIDTDCIGSCLSNDHDHDGPRLLFNPCL